MDGNAPELNTIPQYRIKQDLQNSGLYAFYVINNDLDQVVWYYETGLDISQFGSEVWSLATDEYKPYPWFPDVSQQSRNQIMNGLQNMLKSGILMYREICIMEVG